MRPSVRDVALSFAQHCDDVLAGDTTDAMEDALVFGVGDLLGGLSIKGFAADLRQHLDRVESRGREENPSLWSAGRGGTDPDAFEDSWLADRIADEIEAAAEVWLTQARAIVVSAVPLSEPQVCALLQFDAV